MAAAAFLATTALAAAEARPAPGGDLPLRAPLLLRSGPEPEAERREERRQEREGLLVLPDRPWSEERGYGYRGGKALRASLPAAAGIWGAGESELFARSRVDPGSYRFRLPGGAYLVSLGFCELEEHLPGRRIFDVRIQGRPVRESLDPFALAGFAQAFRVSGAAELEEGGSLLVELVKREGSARPPALSAIWIRPLTPEREPGTPRGFRGAGSYGLNALFWEPPEEGEAAAGFVLERRGPGEEGFRALTTEPLPVARWIDEEVRAGSAYEYRLSAVSLSGRRGPWSPSLSLRPRGLEASTLPVYRLEVSGEDRARLLSRVRGEIRVDARLTAGGLERPARLKLHGASTRDAARLGYQVKLKGKEELEGRRAFYLKAEPGDFTLQQEKLSCDLFAALGLPASRARHVNLFLNGRYQGVYLDLDAVDGSLPARVGLAPGLVVRSASFQDVGGKIGRKLGSKGRKSDLVELLRSVARLERGEFVAFLRSSFDWPRLLDYLVASTLCHRSEIEADDFYYYRDGSRGLWYLLPWDHNNGNFAVAQGRRVVGRPFMPLFGQTLQGLGPERPWWYALPSRVFQEEDLRREYLERLEALARSELLGGKLGEAIDLNHRRLRDEVPLDPYRWPPGRDEPFQASADELKRFAREHGSRLLDLIEAERRRPPEPVVVSELRLAAEKPWIELWNRGSSAVSLRGYRIMELRRGEGPRFHLRLPPGESLEPDAFRVVELPAPGLDPRGGAFAFLAPREQDPIADFFLYGRQSPGFSYGRIAAGFGFLEPTPGAPNPTRGELPPAIEDRRSTLRAGQPVQLEAEVTLAAPGPPPKVTLHYSLGAAIPEKEMRVKEMDVEPLEAGIGRRYLARSVLPAEAEASSLRYYYLARTAAGLERPAPLTAPLETYTRLIKGKD